MDAPEAHPLLQPAFSRVPITTRFAGTGYLAPYYALLLETQLAALQGATDLRGRLETLDTALMSAPASNTFETGNLIAARLWRTSGSRGALRPRSTGDDTTTACIRSGSRTIGRSAASRRWRATPPATGCPASDTCCSEATQSRRSNGRWIQSASRSPRRIAPEWLPVRGPGRTDCRCARPTETALADSLRRDPAMGDVMLSCAGETVVGVSGTAKSRGDRRELLGLTL